LLPLQLLVHAAGQSADHDPLRSGSDRAVAGGGKGARTNRRLAGEALKSPGSFLDRRAGGGLRDRAATAAEPAAGSRWLFALSRRCEIARGVSDEEDDRRSAKSARVE